MASTWQRVLATAKVVLQLYGVGTASTSEHEAIELVRNLDKYQRQQLEQRLQYDGDSDGAAWVSRNS